MSIVLVFIPESNNNTYHGTMVLSLQRTGRTFPPERFPHASSTIHLLCSVIQLRAFVDQSMPFQILLRLVIFSNMFYDLS